MMKKIFFLESNKSWIFVWCDSKWCFFFIVFFYFVRLNYYYIISMIVYLVVFLVIVVVFYIGVCIFFFFVSFLVKMCVYFVNVLMVMFCVWVFEWFMLCIYSYIIGYDIGFFVNGIGWIWCFYVCLLIIFNEFWSWFYICREGNLFILCWYEGKEIVWL